LSSDELLFANLAYGTGVNKFHNIFIGGVNLRNPKFLTVGYGLGSSFTIGRRWNFSMSVSAQHIQSVSNNDFTINNLSKFYAGFEYKLHNKFIFGLGPTFSVLNSDMNDKDYDLFFKNLAPYSLYQDINNGIETTLWVGARAYFKVF
jgi:hypothetical protein